MNPEHTLGNPFLPTDTDPGILILDGGLATALEARGFDLDDPLWSARLLIEAPDAIRQVHGDFLAAGADCIATVSYQASLQGFGKRGIGRDEGLELLRLATRLAVEARDDFWSVVERRIGRRRPLVAASVGPYGAYLADGSEYTGDYRATEAELYDFHRERWHLFADGPADLLACETIPSRREVGVILQLLRETPRRQAWLSVSCRDAAHLSDGTPVGEVARLCDSVPNLVAVGMNCTKPEFIEPLLRELGRHTGKPLIAYPNAGEDYRAESRTWAPPASPVDWGREARRWIQAGARGVGGCCRVGPREIHALRNSLAI
ncbi:MAG: homocysteine S-methyltransferase [Gemmatimonadales bacterium]|nr:MAG: homocysteine S-methyltransferase [Gemmatimonadales bacterium]